MRAGRGGVRPGTKTPLRSPRRPPRTTAQVARPSAFSLTASSMRPSSSRTRSPLRTVSTNSWWLTSMSDGSIRGPAVSTTRRPRTRRWNDASSSPVRIFGPCRSPTSAIGRPTAAAAARTSAAARRWVSWSPWEKLSLATSMPARIRFRSTLGDELEGPMVQTMRVRRMTDFIGTSPRCGRGPSRPPGRAAPARAR